MTSTRTISFDLDGTLINGPFGAVITDLEDELAARGLGRRREILRRHTALLGSDVMASYDWQRIAADYLSELGTPMPFDLLDRLEQYAAEGRTRILHDRTPELLGSLRSGGWRVLVLTNGWRRYQEPIMRHAGLVNVIDRLITSDDVGAPKPDRVMFDAARGAAVDYVHVGDRLDHDIIGGNVAGARTVLLRRDLPDDHRQDYLDDLARKQQLSQDPDPALARPSLLTAHLGELVDTLLHT